MPGLQFYKLDLHTHTPASKCYLHKDHSPEQIVQAALDKELAAIAVTDHNTADWIDRMKAATQDTGLIAFPGVEISMSEGFHLVALFDPDVDQKHVESFLGSIDIKPEDYGKQEALCTNSVYRVIDKIHDRDGLAILAHIDAPKGAFYTQTKKKDNGKVHVPVNCSKLFNEANFDAIECVAEALPDGFDEAHQFTRFPPIYQASDNPDPEKPTRHSYDGLGELYSWFNLDSIDIEGLRQCFADPEVRIQFSDAHEEIGYPRIVEMRIGGAGFLRYQNIKFHKGLNSIIGGKGVGKSLVVEFLRFGLEQPPGDENLYKDHTSKLSKRLEEGNFVEIIYQQSDGSEYKIHRELTGVYRDRNLETENTCVNMANEEIFSGDIPTMFPILAYSQTEVIKIAEDKYAQLQLVDRFIDKRTYEKRISDIRSMLSENDQKFSVGIQASGNLNRIEVDISTFKEQIAAIDKSIDNPLFDAMKQAEGKKSVLDDRYEYIGELIEQVKEWMEGIEKPDDLPKKLKDDSEADEVNKTAKKARNRLVKVLEGLIEDLTQDRKSISELIMSWLPEFDKVSDQYKELLEEIGGDRKAKERERRRLVKQLKELEGEAKGYRKLIEDLDEVINDRNILLDELERAYYEYYEVRKSKFEHLTELSESKLKLTLEHADDRSDYQEKLMELLKGGGAFNITVGDRRKVAQNVAPRRLVQLVLDKNIPHLANEAELTELWAERVIERLWQAEDFTDVLALQHNCYPEDVPSIRFQKAGGKYGELGELSVGQKCTALLIIALCDGDMPIVIDQPEDAIDIISVWEDIAKKLRRGKNSRQFILTTHNSSVAVAADSDQFIVLKAGAETGKIVAAGAIDRQDVREAVIDHLEGGDEPYKLRARKYNIQQ